MERVLILLLLPLALAEPSSSPRGIIFNLDNGELCFNSYQCKSGCCHRADAFSLARCACKAAENQECSRKHIYGVYYRCLCENGLTCDADRTIVGSITNTDYGICRDQAKQYRINEESH
ncbi:colipase [Eublepharis macularius]|uniref:Colipase n=1 Tax=Eublepharis macularius TaxID=481883 RepID=A0AA97JEV2_EUBMA|nr:colipase [Eublepharis macularius]